MTNIVWGDKGKRDFIPAHQEPELLTGDLDPRGGCCVNRTLLSYPEGGWRHPDLSTNTRDELQALLQKGFCVTNREGSRAIGTTSLSLCSISYVGRGERGWFFNRARSTQLFGEFRIGKWFRSMGSNKNNQRMNDIAICVT